MRRVFADDVIVDTTESGGGIVTGADATGLTGSVTGADPKFTNAAQNDFTLVAGSTAIGAALTSIAGLPDREYYKDETITREYRLRASAKDIGALESTTQGPGIGPGGGSGAGGSGGSATGGAGGAGGTTTSVPAATGGAPATGGASAVASSAGGSAGGTGTTGTTTSAGGKSGCGCRLAGADLSAAPWDAMLALTALAAGRFRRRGKR